MRESSIVKRSPPVKGTQNVARERENFANNNNNNNDGQKQDIEPSLPVKRVVFRLGATVMRQARLTQDTDDDDEEEEQRLVMDLEREEVVRRR